jgi:tRNA(fMet)-specific endonuclease VapC
MLRYLLDTHIVIYVLKRRPVEVLPTFNAHAGRMAISFITLAELLHGAEKSSRVSENLGAVEDFCSRLEVLPYCAKAAQHYGAIRTALEKVGQPIGVNDLHIAAHARSEGLVLVTNNTSEFVRVPALEVENWVLTPSNAPTPLGTSRPSSR